MANRAIERRRIAEKRLDDHRSEREGQRKRKRHDGGFGLDRRRPGVHLSRRRARSRAPARAPGARALDRPLHGHQSTRLSAARSCAGSVVAAARDRRAGEARGRSCAPLRCGRRKRGRRPRLAGAHPCARSHIAARRGRRAHANLSRFRRSLRGRGRSRRRSEAARGHGRARRRHCGQSEQPRWADHSA